MTFFRFLLQLMRLYGLVLLLTFLVGSPVLGLVLVFSWPVALALLVLVAALVCGGLLFYSEKGIVRVLEATAPRSPGVNNSFQQAQFELGARKQSTPELLTFSDPAPNAFVLRSFHGKGVFLLSEGLLNVMEEPEIQEIFKRGIAMLGSRNHLIQGACVFALCLLQNLTDDQSQVGAPSGATRPLTPLQGFKRLLIAPWQERFLKLAEQSGAASSTRRVAGGFDFSEGRLKLERARRLYGQQAALPGLVYLGIER